MAVTLFKKSVKQRLFFLDYDGTISALQALPEIAKPTPGLMEILSKLASLPNTLVYIMSGRPRSQMDKWFGSLNVGLSAEHGCFYRHPPTLPDANTITEADLALIKQQDSVASSSSTAFLPFTKRRPMQNGWYALVDQYDLSWRSTILPLLAHYTERTPGSFLEEKEVNLSWNYRNTDSEYGTFQVQLLFNHNLGQRASNQP